MDLAKVPDCDVPQWEYVDIYLFSNGQQQTPPRKYHLKSNELEEWQDTLRALAQSQYGSEEVKMYSSVLRKARKAVCPRYMQYLTTTNPHWARVVVYDPFFLSVNRQCMIDLYTVDGLKVETPIEVAHENAYVAVPPHDKFIPAGYSEYLLKASRSREKRLSKLKKPITLALARAVDEEKNKSTGKKDTESRLPTVGGSTTTHNTTTSSGDQHAPQAQTISNNNITGKFLDKRTLNNSTLLRKNNPNISGEMVKRPSMKSRENLSKKFFKVSTGKIGSKDPVLIINHNNSVKTKGKIITKLGKDNTLIDRQKKTENMPVIPNAEENSLKTINEKITTTESALIENVIDDKELIVVKNTDSMILYANKYGSKSARQTVTSTTIPVLPLFRESKSQENEQQTTLDIIGDDVENMNKPQGAENYELTSQEKIEINVNHPSKMLINQDAAKKSVLINDNRSTENFVSLIEKGDVVSLNLQIEVRKCDGVIKTRYDTHTKKLRSITEKCSQVEIDEEFLQSIEKHSNIIDSMVVNKENPKVIVLQCACCDNQDFNKMFQKIDTSLNLEDKKHVILLSNPEYEKLMQRCHCGMASKVDSARFSVMDPVRKVNAVTKLLEKTDNDKTENNDTKDDTVEKTQAIGLSASQIQSSSRNIPNEELKYKNTANNNMSKENNINPESTLLQKNTNDNVLVPHENANSELNTEQSNISRNTREPETLNIRKNASNMTKQFKESSAQTEWSSLLLEARRHNDGLYSFHLPPLSVLKCYFL